MEINRHNYESYFIDFLEGNLDKLLMKEFNEFLLSNPDLKEELDGIKTFIAEPGFIKYYKKDNLYKDKYDLESEFNRASVALLEGDLSDKEKSDFEACLSRDTDKEKEFRLFRMTKLHPDTDITFNKKNKLYRHTIGKTVLYWSGRIAAILILSLSVYIYINKSPDNKEEKLSVAENVNRQKAENEAIIIDNKAPDSKSFNEPLKPGIDIRPGISQDKTFIAEIKISDKVTEKENIEVVKSARERTYTKPPPKLKSYHASLADNTPKEQLAEIKLKQYMNSAEIAEKKLIGDLVKEKTGLGTLTFDKVAKAGLKLISGLSKDKLEYETNSNGKISEVSFDSRLLAFSIPTDNKSDK